MPTPIRLLTSLRAGRTQPGIAPPLLARTVPQEQKRKEPEARDPEATRPQARKAAAIDTRHYTKYRPVSLFQPPGAERTGFKSVRENMTKEQLKVIDPDSIYINNDSGRFYDLSDPDKPLEVKIHPASGHPYPADTNLAQKHGFPAAEGKPGPGWQGQEWDWTGWGAVGEGGKGKVEISREGGPGETPIIKGGPGWREHELEKAAAAEMPAAKPTAVDILKAEQAIGARNTRIQQAGKAQPEALKILAPYGNKAEGYNIALFAFEKGRDAEDTVKTLKDAGYTKSQIDKAREWARQEEIRQSKLQYEAPRGEDVKRFVFTPRTFEEESAKQVWESMTPWDEIKGEVASAKGVVTMAGELLVPGVYTKNRWNDLTPTERAFSIGLDVVTTAAMAFPVISAGATGARAVATSGRVARLAGAAKGAGRAAAAQLRAPVDMVIHPVGAAKSAGRQIRELSENIAHPRKLPEAVITTTEGTVRLRVSEATTEARAMAIRDQLMRLAAKGEHPVVQIGTARVELAQSPLMRELKGGAVHATPQGGAFKEGLQVAPKPGMSAAEQGLFLSHEPLPRFTTVSAFGKAGESPSIIIISPETSGLAVPTGKIYRGTAEMELKFPVGTKLNPPKQTLFTRIGTQGTRVEILLEKPLTAGQIAKLKALDLVEQVKAPFKPAILVERVGKGQIGLTGGQVDELTRILERSGNAGTARQLQRAESMAARMRAAGRAAIPATIRTIPRRVSTATEGYAPVRVKGVESRFTATQPRTGAELQRTERMTPAARSEYITRVSREEEREARKRGRAGRLTGQGPGTRAGGLTGRLTEKGERVTPERESPERVPSIREPSGRIPSTRPPITRVPPTRLPPTRVPPTRVPPIRVPPPGVPRQPPPETPTGKLTRRHIPTGESRRQAFAGSFGWQQGVVVWAGKYPFNRAEDYAAFSIKNPPPGFHLVPGGPGAAARSIQQIYGIEVPTDLVLNLGIQDVHPNVPSDIPGKAGAIGYTADIGQKTKGDVTLGEKKIRIISQKAGPVRLMSGGNGGGYGHIPRTRRGQAPRFKSLATGLRSRRIGKIFHTKVGGGSLLSRHSLGRKRRR